MEIVAQIRTLPGTAATGSAEPEEIAENIAESAEHILGRAEMIAETLAVDACMAEAIILGAFARITQNFIGFRRFLEFVLGFGVIGITVRVVMKGKLAVGGLDFISRRGPAHAENFVIITLNGHYSSCASSVTKLKFSIFSASGITLPSAISRRAVTTSLFLLETRGSYPS